MRRGVCLIVAVFGLAAAAGASATPPPVGKYGCTIGADSLYAGDLQIIDGSHYRLNKSKVGTFVSAGKKLTFTSGVWKGLLKGTWMITTEHRPQLALTELKNGFTSEYCVKE